MLRGNTDSSAPRLTYRPSECAVRYIVVLIRRSTGLVRLLQMRTLILHVFQPLIDILCPCIRHGAL